MKESREISGGYFAAVLSNYSCSGRKDASIETISGIVVCVIDK